MKKLTLILVFIAVLAGCKQNTQKAENNKTATVEKIATTDSSAVNVYYFHGKQRCKTCIAVGNIAKETVEKEYADNEKVLFVEINISDKANEALAEKYEVLWNALIIAKGENFVEITEQAFATALDNPQSLKNLIKKEVNKLLID